LPVRKGSAIKTAKGAQCRHLRGRPAAPVQKIPAAKAAGISITRRCYGDQQQASGAYPVVDGIAVDQATIIAYAAGYVAAVFGAFLLYLPILICIGLLLLVAGTVTLVVFLIKALTVGLYRFLARELRTPTGRLHGGPDAGGLVPH
jgi:hypothetical protein